MRASRFRVEIIVKVPINQWREGGRVLQQIFLLFIEGKYNIYHLLLKLTHKLCIRRSLKNRGLRTKECCHEHADEILTIYPASR